MIGPPGLPKFGRRVFALAGRPAVARARLLAWRWIAGLYFAGVLAHFGHHLAFDFPNGHDPSFDDALASAPVSLVWPADLIHTLVDLG
jgi:hypothetical protein